MPLMPWQQHVANVAFEYDPDTNLFAYREIVLTVPRQSGKTALLLAVMLHRATRMGPRQFITYTAQNRLKALAKYRDEFIPIIEKSAYCRRGLYHERKEHGSEALLWANTSIFGIDAPTETSGHGPTLALGVIDEAFARPDDRVEEAMAPAMIAVRNPHLWILSTAGNEKSPYLYRKVLDGREHDGLPSTTAYFEWSADMDADPNDPRTWWSCMPALGLMRDDGSGITEAAIRAELDRALRNTSEDGLKLFRRAYLNQWVDIPILDSAAPKLIPVDWFDACTDKRSRMRGRRVLVPDISKDRTSAAIVAVAQSTRVGKHVEVVEHKPGQGSDWVLPRLKEIAKDRSDIIVAAHLGGPVGSLEQELKAAFGDRFRPVSDAELSRGCGGVYSGIREGTFKHLGSPALRGAVEGASRSNRGDSWRFTRTSELTDMTTLMGASVGWYVIDLPDTTPPPPATASTPAAPENTELFRPRRRLRL